MQNSLDFIFVEGNYASTKTFVCLFVVVVFSASAWEFPSLVVRCFREKMKVKGGVKLVALCSFQASCGLRNPHFARLSQLTTVTYCKSANVRTGKNVVP